MTKHFRWLAFIILIVVAAVWIALPDNPGIHLSIGGTRIDRDIEVRQGLDLQGGIQVLLEAQVPEGATLQSESMEAAKLIIERRVNALGVVEPLIQLAQNNRIIVELPGVKDPDRAVQTFGQTGRLEFVGSGSTPLQLGDKVATTLGGPESPASTEEGSETETAEPDAEALVYETVIEGRHLSDAAVGYDELNRVQIEFSLTPEGTEVFGDFTSKNVGKWMSILMDKEVISSAVIETAITRGRGVIRGGASGYPLEEAQSTVIQLKYGALPVPLKIIQTRTVGPSLGQDSLQKSYVAGAVGLAIVAIFMVIYYRLAGLVANLALASYAVIVFAIFKNPFQPVTLTLAGGAGFILSVGMAVDANILIFERTKEELRIGKSMRSALEAGFDRAWSSIRDSNISTLITCAILIYFGATLGASIIQGFAVTLAIGVLVSMFTAIIVSRTLLRILFGIGGGLNRNWFPAT